MNINSCICFSWIVYTAVPIHQHLETINISRLKIVLKTQISTMVYYV